MKKNMLRRTPRNHSFTTLVLCISTFLLFAACFLPLVSCTPPTPSIQLPDGSVTMIVTDGDASYFTIDLSGVPPGFDVTNTAYNGWCADRSAVMPRGEELTVRLYNSYDSSLPRLLRDRNWSKVNYLLNHHQGAVMNDVQDVLWYFLCAYPYSLLSSAAKTLADSVQDGFIPQPGEWVAIIAEPIRNDSNPWPFQIAFLQVRLSIQDPTDPEDPEQPPQSTTWISHGYRYNDIAPTAATNGPYTAYTAEPVEFSAAASHDPDGIIIAYHWCFGDGTTADEITASHAYSHAGVYPVTLTVRDNFGLTDTEHTTATITTKNNPPTPPLIGGPTTGTTNTKYSYAFVSHDHEDITYHIDWGDGTPLHTATQPSGKYVALLHQWNTPGVYTITVTASDGSLQSTAEKNVRINELPIADNLIILGLALLALIALLAIILYSKKKKNTP